MRRVVLAAFLLAGCTSIRPAMQGGSPIAGIWRGADGQSLSISLFSSFATQDGCTISGGMLRPLGGARYRIERYATGFASDRCGAWRSGPAIAPFDGAEVTLERVGERLIASGAGTRLVFRWVAESKV